MKLKDLLYVYGASVVYRLYIKPTRSSVIDCGEMTFERLCEQKDFLERDLICRFNSLGGVLIVVI